MGKVLVCDRPGCNASTFWDGDPPDRIGGRTIEKARSEGWVYGDRDESTLRQTSPDLCPAHS